MPISVYNRVSGDVHPLTNDILVINMERGDKITKSGLIITDDNGKNRGIRPRWAQIYKVGKNLLEEYPELEEGKYILISHGRWTFGIDVDLPDDRGSIYLQKVEPAAILGVTDECPI